MPTGSRDPFALRRAALGSIRIILENGLRLPLRSLSSAATTPFDLNSTAFVTFGRNSLPFIADRLKVHLREQGVRHDLIAAVFALEEDDLVRLMARVDALQKFLEPRMGPIC